MIKINDNKIFKKSLNDFPISYEKLCKCYSNFTAQFEFHRSPIDSQFWGLLEKKSLIDAEKEINNNYSKWLETLRQRHFYMSSTSFYRSFQLFLAYLTLDKYKYKTWGDVTGYYSRFYFIQAFLNLLQCSLIFVKSDIKMKNNKDRNFIIYNSGDKFVFLNLNKSKLFSEASGSHQKWWRLFQELDKLEDYKIENIDFILSDGYFNPVKRNKVNYSHDYLEGFIELEWFDTGLTNMMAHFNMQHTRSDRDITDIDRFFKGYDPEFSDEGDFYGDEAQIMWCSIKVYLQLLNSLPIKQDFIALDKLEALSREHIQSIFPNIHSGIVESCREILD